LSTIYGCNVKYLFQTTEDYNVDKGNSILLTIFLLGNVSLNDALAYNNFKAKKQKTNKPHTVPCSGQIKVTK
jgi:hypothetical protein